MIWVYFDNILSIAVLFRFWNIQTVIQELPMRLTEEQRKIIREARLRHFGVIPHLFGSRLNDADRGGDIDLFIPGDWSPREAVPRRLRFCAELHRRLGDQKIDVVVENKATPSSVLSQAIHQGQPV